MSEIVLRRTPLYCGFFLVNRVEYLNMDRKRLFKILARLIVLIFILNYLGSKFHLYVSIWYFDMPMHFLGGLFIGLALIWLLSYKDLSLGLSLKLIFKILFYVLLFGVSWEIFEILVNNTFAKDLFNTLDTFSDIFFDLAGGTFAIFYFFYLKNEIILITKNTV